MASPPHGRSTILMPSERPTAALPRGRCDLHCHLLYGLDDGAKTLADSLEMARVLVEMGYSVVAASPHARAGMGSPELAAERLSEVQRALEDLDIPLRLYPNGENFLLEEGFFDPTPGPARRLLAAGPFILVEAPYQAPVPALREMVFRLTLQGVVPVFAHPERCVEFSRLGRAQELVQAGALLQLDLGSLVGRYGVPARKLAVRFLGEGLYAVAATDLHNVDRAREWLRAALAELERLVGGATLQALTDENPKRLLSGSALAV